MRTRLLTLLVVCSAWGCARTEILEAPQGTTTSGAATSATTSASASATLGTSSGGPSTTGQVSASAGTSSAGASGTTRTSATASASGGTSASAITNSTGGPASSSGTSGSSGGAECAPCSSTADCASGGLCIADQSGAKFCTGACTQVGPTCADPASICLPVGPGGELGCIPRSFSCQGTTSSTGGFGANTTTSGGFSSTTTSGGVTSNTTTSGGFSSTTTSGGFTSTTTSGGVTSSTTTTGGFTSSTTTTGGFSSSTTGTTGGGDCTSLGCPAGESCSAFPGSAGPYFTCTCTQATASAPSSCASSTDGSTVCDANTLKCRPPRDFERCNSGPGVAACESGEVCIFGYCVQPCTTTSDCSATFTRCVNRVGQGYCEPNRCGPGTSNGDYYQPCTVVTPGDGTCQPFADANGNVSGYCLADGPTPTGAPCPGFGVDKPDQCVAGDLCFAVGSPPPDGGTSARCYATCNANPAGGYPRACSGGSACFTNSPPTAAPDPGICYP